MTRAALVSVLVLAGCGEASAPPASRPSDVTVYKPVGVAPLISASGAPVSLRQFYGGHLWVDFAAEWCAACTPQSRTIKALSSSSARNMAFVTVMTSERGGYGHPATRATAARWAERFGLEPSRVLATDLSAMTLPRNVLYSPAGEVLFDHTGELSAAEIRAVLDERLGK